MKNYIDRKILESLITKYGKLGVESAINRLNENDRVNLNKPFYVTTKSDDYDDLDESLNENYNFVVNEMGAISRNEIENHGWETQIRNVNKKSEDAIYASLYCWLPKGEYVDAVPEQLQSNVISWESNLFGFETEVGLVPDNAYLMHNGECVVINGYIRML